MHKHNLQYYVRFFLLPPLWIMGIVFLSLGVYNTLHIFAYWHLTGTVAWYYMLYSALFFLAAYGFFTHQKWVWYALMTNTATMLLIGVFSLIQDPNLLHHTDLAVGISLNLLILAYVYKYLPSFSKEKKHQAAGVVLLGLLALNICYTLIIHFA